MLTGIAKVRGSPPHMRGKGSRCRTLRHTRRITPAYAGKSAKELSKGPFYKDHPRICGEKYISLSPYFFFVGSPPHMRGKDFWHYADNYSKGITPAYAGKSRYAIKRHPSGWDHPRICGEKNMRMLFMNIRLGSPPHMRGKETCISVSPTFLRITPAYAGKSIFIVIHNLTSWDHPRICGEKGLSTKSSWTFSGSPPHMRGKEKAVHGF